MNQYSLSELIKSFALALANHGVDPPLKDAEELIAAALGLRRLDLYLHYHRLLTEEEYRRCERYLKRRCKREPLQYILERVTFCDLTLSVSPDVLIPRSETELLVELIIKELMGQDLKGKVLWDIGTGSGCIGIALKKRFPDLTVFLSDISERALACAQKNADENQVEAFFLRGDLFSPFGEGRADYIVSNPPYVTEEEFGYLQPEVRYYEPRISLVSGERGVEYYERFADQIERFLKGKGSLFFEMGRGQGPQLIDIFANRGFHGGRIIKDFSEIDRFFFLESHSSS